MFDFNFILFEILILMSVRDHICIIGIDLELVSRGMFSYANDITSFNDISQHEPPLQVCKSSLIPIIRNSPKKVSTFLHSYINLWNVVSD